MMMKGPLIIAGGYSTAVEIEEAARALEPGRKVARVWGDAEQGVPAGGLRQRDLEGWLRDSGGEARAIVSMVNPGLRKSWRAVFDRFGLRYETVRDPGSHLSPSAVVGEGCYLAFGSVISSGAAVGGHCLINYRVVVGHDAVLEQDVAVHPGGSLGGGCHLEEGVMIGANSFVVQGVRVGAFSKVDALTYVDRDIPAGSLVSTRGGRLRILPNREVF